MFSLINLTPNLIQASSIFLFATVVWTDGGPVCPTPADWLQVAQWLVSTLRRQHHRGRRVDEFESTVVVPVRFQSELDSGHKFLRKVAGVLIQCINQL